MRGKENDDECERRHAKDRESKKRKIATGTDEERATRLARKREQRRLQRQQRALETADDRLNQLNQPNEQFPVNFQQLTESDHKLLQKFRTEMNKIEHKFCPVCDGHRCYNDKNEVKKFSAENNMNPGDVP